MWNFKKKNALTAFTDELIGILAFVTFMLLNTLHDQHGNTKH